MNKMQEQVAEFHKAFNLPSPHTPQINIQDLGFRFKLITEELSESFDAIWLASTGNPLPTIDLLCDLLYFIHGTAVSMGIDLEPFFDEVHRANMSKLGPDGKPMYREDGKVAKPDTFKECDLLEVWEETYGTGTSDTRVDVRSANGEAPGA